MHKLTRLDRLDRSEIEQAYDLSLMDRLGGWFLSDTHNVVLAQIFLGRRLLTTEQARHMALAMDSPLNELFGLEKE